MNRCVTNDKEDKDLHTDVGPMQRSSFCSQLEKFMGFKPSSLGQICIRYDFRGHITFSPSILNHRLFVFVGLTVTVPSEGTPA